MFSGTSALALTVRLKTSEVSSTYSDKETKTPPLVQHKNAFSACLEKGLVPELDRPEMQEWARALHGTED